MTTQDEDGFPIGTTVSGEERKAARQRAVETLDLTPTPNGYRSMLELIKSSSTVEADREWAAAELARVSNVTEWSAR